MHLLRRLLLPLSAYTRWLHTRWPAGSVERLPVVRDDGGTTLPGVYVVGDLTGIPLLKFSSDSGARTVRTICSDSSFAREKAAAPGVLDLVIVGAGVAGVAAAMEAKKRGLSFQILEASEPFSTIVNFPKAKPIYTYPRQMKPTGDLQFTADVKEALVDELRGHLRRAGIEVTHGRAEKVSRADGCLEVTVADPPPLRARRVILALGRSGNFRKLGCPGEDLDKVSNRLHDPKDYAGRTVLVVGGGDSALEAAIALAVCGAHVTLSYRKKEFSRPKPENVEKIEMLQRDPASSVMVEHPTSERVTTSAGPFMKPGEAHGSLRVRLGTSVREIRPDSVILRDEAGREETVPNDAVFSMIGREAPLGFFRRSGLRIHGEWTVGTYVSCALFLLFCVFLYNWKAGGALKHVFEQNGWFPFNLGAPIANPKHLFGTIAISLRDPGFYYSFLYCACVVGFGVRRIRRRRTPYVTRQTITLMLIQCIPLFLLPYVLLPWAGQNGWFDSGVLKTAADNLFPWAGYGHGREYWRAFGLILAWPLFIWNVFTAQPLWWWLVISLVQTCVLIPLIIWRWGKGAYCGWICSCGALAETLGDAHRTKMPHGPLWNRLNMVGQVVLLAALVLLVARGVAWVSPGGVADRFFHGLLSGWQVAGVPLNYYWIVDVGMAGILGVGLYFWFSGRVWCRFACPLAALMHVYARFSRFRIFAEKKKCISCNVCTSVCHQGIDVMNFANKGVAMQDPQCVRCSACVQSCPTGVLTFGRVDAEGNPVHDKLAASPVRMRERT